MINPFVSIVFATHKIERYPYILKALDTISKQTYKNFEVIIVVDSDDRELCSMLDTLKGKYSIDIRILVNDEIRQGPAVARNKGIYEANGEIVAIIDDDVFVSPDWLEKTIRNFEQENVLMVGGKILPSYEDDSSILPEEILWVVGCTYKGHPVQRQYVRNVISANMAFRKKIFDFISFEKLPGSGHWRMSDTSIGLRLNEIKPNSVVYDPDPVVYHNVPKKRTEIIYIMKRSYMEGYLKSFLNRTVKKKNVYYYESSYLITMLLSIPRYTLTFRFRYAFINSIVIMSVFTGFLVGTLKGIGNGQ